MLILLYWCIILAGDIEMNTAERKKLAEELIDDMAQVEVLKRRSTDTVTLYQKAMLFLLGILITILGSYVGFVIYKNEQEHKEIRRDMGRIQRVINMPERVNNERE